MLPFPFDSVESFFKQLFNDILREIKNIIGDVVKAVAPLIAKISDSINGAVTKIQAAIFGQLEAFKNSILGILTGLPSAVANLLGGISGAIQPLFNSIKSSLTGISTQIITTINSQILPFLRGIPGQIQSIANIIISSVNTTIRPIIGAISQNINSLFSLIQAIPQSLSSQFTSMTTFLNGELNKVLLSLQPAFQRISGFTEATFNAVQDTRVGLFQFASNVQTQLNSFGPAFTDALGAQFQAAITNANGLAKQYLDPIINSLGTLPQAIHNIIRPTGSITPEAARGEMEQAGIIMLGAYAGVNATAALLETFTAGQVDQIIRGVIDTMDDVGLDVFATDYVTFDYEVGVKPALTRETLRRYVPNIPGAGDLVNMVVKEAFVESLRTPAPDIFAKFMAEQGFNQFWSDTFWTAHWQPIELESITQMFHRGIIDEADFIRRLIILDFRPDDTELVKQLTFKLPNRIEARLMARFGILTDAQLDEIIKAEGVREDFVEPLRIMMQDFNLTNIFTRTESRAVSSFEDGLINESQFATILVDIKRPPNVVNADIKLGRFKRLMDFKDKQMKSVVKALKRGNITAADATGEMQKIGIDAEVIDFAIANAQFELDLGASANVKANAPKLTASQLSTAVKKGLIEPEEALSTLQAKGYDAQEATLLLQIKDAVPA